jgi:hypothetical protein
MKEIFPNMYSGKHRVRATRVVLSTFCLASTIALSACVMETDDPARAWKDETEEPVIAEFDLESPDEAILLEDLGAESFAPEGFAPEAVRLHTSETIHFGGTIFEEDHYPIVGGDCLPGGTRISPPTVMHAGHGHCDFDGWVTPDNPADCRARIHVHHSAGWLYGDCYVDIFEQYEPNSCQGLCGGQAPGGCWCDSYCRTADDCCMDNDPVCVLPEIYQTGLSGPAGSWRGYTLSVPPGRAKVVFKITGGSGDADLYVRYGALPTTTLWDCRPYIGGNEETCTIPSPAAGTWYVSVRGYNSYSGVTLTGDHDR